MLVLTQLKGNLFYSYVSHADEHSKLWHERLGHLNYGKMKLLTKMVHGEMFEKGKAWRAKEPLQLIHSDICDPLEVPSISHAVYFLTFIDDFR